MEIKVNEEPELFYIALDKWTAAAGHGIEIENFKFAVIPTDDSLNVIEESTGIRVAEIEWTEQRKQATETKELAIQFFQDVALELVRVLETKPDYWEQIEKAHKMNIKQIGEKPPTEKLDLEQYARERTE